MNSKNTTDELRGRLYEILDNNSLVVTETLAENAIDGIITIISNREKLLLDRLEAQKGTTGIIGIDGRPIDIELIPYEDLDGDSNE